MVAFLVAVYWVTRVERDDDNAQPAVMQIWTRFPKFILGFLGASLLFSFVLTPTMGEEAVTGILDLTSGFRGWFFCLAFGRSGAPASPARRRSARHRCTRIRGRPGRPAAGTCR